MTSDPEVSSNGADVCAGAKRLGYIAKQTVRLYGEEFPEAGGVAVTARTKKNDNVWVVRLPATVVQSVKAGWRRAA